jgi:hypothetical protein
MFTTTSAHLRPLPHDATSPVDDVVDSFHASLYQVVRLLACAAHAPVAIPTRGTRTSHIGRWTALAMPNLDVRLWLFLRVEQYVPTRGAISPATCRFDAAGKDEEGKDVVRERAVGDIDKVEPWEHCSGHREEAQKMLATLFRDVEHAAGGDLAGPIVYCSLRRRRKDRKQTRQSPAGRSWYGPSPALTQKEVWKIPR